MPWPTRRSSPGSRASTRIARCIRSRCAASTSNCLASSVCWHACRAPAPRDAPCSTVRQLVQPGLECLRRELSLRSRLGSRERDLDIRERDLSLMLEMSSNQTVDRRRRRIRPHPQDGPRAHGLRPRGALGSGQEYRAVPDPQRPPDVAGVPAACATASDGVDAAAATHHRRQSHLQGGERCGGSVQDTGLSGASPVRTGHGRSRALQPAERPRLRRAPNARRRIAREAGRRSSSRRNTIPAPAS